MKNSTLNQSANSSSPSLSSASSLNESACSSISTTCAWRIPKSNANPPPAPIIYPQRKIPSCFEEPVKPKEENKPKSYVESFEEFPELIKSKKSSNLSTLSISTSTLTKTAINFDSSEPGNLLLLDEADDWLLSGDDNIDYSRNLFKDSNNFALESSNIRESTCFNNNNHIDSNHNNRLNQSTYDNSSNSSLTKPKISFKILKRPEPIIEKIVEEEDKKLTESLESGLKLNEESCEVIKKNKKNPSRRRNGQKNQDQSSKTNEEVVESERRELKKKQEKQPPIKEKNDSEAKKEKKIIYSIATKTIQSV